VRNDDGIEPVERRQLRHDARLPAAAPGVALVELREPNGEVAERAGFLGPEVDPPMSLAPQLVHRCEPLLGVGVADDRIRRRAGRVTEDTSEPTVACW
jgi:hypothetical protein